MEKELKLKAVKIEDKGGYQRLIIPGKDAIKMKAGCVTLASGESVGEHSTGSKEEAILILQGKAAILCGSRRIEVQERTIIYIPPETGHNVMNIGQDTLQYVFICNIGVRP